MHESTDAWVPTLLKAMQHDGFRFVTADNMRPLLASSGDLSDWHPFAESWNRLEPDPYLAATGRLRRRRHATFSAKTDGRVQREAHQPHYQSLQYNALQGDIQRWFAPIESVIAQSDSLQAILTFCLNLFGSLAPTTANWHIEVHQFRIEANPDKAGEPTPEGSHRDGVDFVLVLLIDRENIARGTTTIHAPDATPLGQFTLTHALDAAFIHDPRVFHGVTPVTPIDPLLPAHRDVLVVTFKAKV